jgi:hypothetical protein
METTQTIGYLEREDCKMSICKFRLKDEKGRTTMVNVETGGADANTELINAIQAGVLLQNVTNLELLSGNLTIPISVSGTTAAVGSRTDLGGKVRGVSDDDGKIVLVRIPDPIAAIVNSTGGFVLTETNLAAYLTEFETGGDNYCSDGEQVSSWVYGELDAR